MVNADQQSVSFSSGEQQVHLLELYTSEGCSSCPPAEAWFSQLQQHPQLWKGLVPVVFHVDYWDYLGWRDPFSSAENSLRQRRYRQQGGINSVYTPGFVLNGKEWRNWFARRPLVLKDHQAGQLDVQVHNGSVIAAFADGKGERPLQLHVALLGFDLSTEVRSGENSGRNLTHQFVVLAQSSGRADDGGWQLPLPVSDKVAEKRALAIWVTETGQQKPLQATGGWLPHNS